MDRSDNNGGLIRLTYRIYSCWSNKGKAENPAVVQSLRLDVSASCLVLESWWSPGELTVFIPYWKSEEAGVAPAVATW